MKLRIVIITIIALLTSGLSCSVMQGGEDKNVRTLFEGGELIPGKGTKIYVNNFESGLYKNFNSKELVSRLKRNINSDVTLTVTDIKDEAEIILTGIITAYTIQPVEFNLQGQPELKRLRLTLALTLYNPVREHTIFRSRIVEAMHEYSDTRFPVETELRAQLKLIDKIVPRIISQIYTGWYTDQLTPAERGNR